MVSCIHLLLINYLLFIGNICLNLYGTQKMLYLSLCQSIKHILGLWNILSDNETHLSCSDRLILRRKNIHIIAEIVLKL